MQMLKKISWAFLGVFLAVPLVYASAAYIPTKKNQNHHGSRWMLGNSVVQTVDTDTNVITMTRGGVTYTVNYTDTTKILRNYNATAAETEIHIGDKLKVYGTLTDLTVTATKIKDLSLVKANGKFKGNVLSIDNVSTPKSFVLHTSNRGDRTIEVSGNVVIKYHGKAKLFTDLDLRQRVLVVKGVWNRNTNDVYDVTRVTITKW